MKTKTIPEFTKKGELIQKLELRHLIGNLVTKMNNEDAQRPQSTTIPNMTTRSGSKRGSPNG